MEHKTLIEADERSLTEWVCSVSVCSAEAKVAHGGLVWTAKQ